MRFHPELVAVIRPIIYNAILKHYEKRNPEESMDKHELVANKWTNNAIETMENAVPSLNNSLAIDKALKDINEIIINSLSFIETPERYKIWQTIQKYFMELKERLDEHDTEAPFIIHPEVAQTIAKRVNEYISNHGWDYDNSIDYGTEIANKVVMSLTMDHASNFGNEDEFTFKQQHIDWAAELVMSWMQKKNFHDYDINNIANIIREELEAIKPGFDIFAKRLAARTIFALVIAQNNMHGCVVEPIHEFDKDTVMQMLFSEYGHLISLDEIITHTNQVTDWSKSVKLSYNGQLVGFCLLGNRHLFDGVEENGDALNDDIKARYSQMFGDKTGTECVAFYISKEFKNSEAAQQLLDYMKQFPNDFYWGNIFKSIDAQNFWPKQSADIENVYNTEDYNYVVYHPEKQNKTAQSSGRRKIIAISADKAKSILEKKFTNNPRLINNIIACDPTPNHGYSVWIAKLVVNKDVILPEDTQKIRQELMDFEELKNRGKIKGIDISRIENYGDLARLVEEASGKKSNNEKYTEKLQAGAQTVYEDGRVKVVKVTTGEAAVKLSRGTKWCTVGTNLSKQYVSQSPLYIFFDNNGNRIALLHEYTKQFKDVYDKKVDVSISNLLAKPIIKLGLVRNTPVNNTDFENLAMAVFEINPLYSAYFAIYAAKNNEAGQFPKELMGAIYSSPTAACYYAVDVIGDEWTEGEPIIATDALCSYLYAKNAKKAPFKQGETAIAKDPKIACEYARYVLGGEAFPEAEQVIASNPEWALYYANFIKKGRWPEAESVIAQNPENAYFYARKYFGGPWPEAENTIKDDAKTAYYYAKLNLNAQRWTDAEKTIINNAEIAYLYAKDIIKGRWPEAEATISQDPKLAYFYSLYVVNGRWPESEPAIAKDKFFAKKYMAKFPESEKDIQKYSSYVTSASFLNNKRLAKTIIAKIKKDK